MHYPSVTRSCNVDVLYVACNIYKHSKNGPPLLCLAMLLSCSKMYQLYRRMYLANDSTTDTTAEPPDTAVLCPTLPAR